jgi:hypothetical protein
MPGQELGFGRAEYVDDSVADTNGIKRGRWQNGLLWVRSARRAGAPLA